MSSLDYYLGRELFKILLTVPSSRSLIKFAALFLSVMSLNNRQVSEAFGLYFEQSFFVKLAVIVVSILLNFAISQNFVQKFSHSHALVVEKEL